MLSKVSEAGRARLSTLHWYCAPTSPWATSSPTGSRPKANPPKRNDPPGTDFILYRHKMYFVTRIKRRIMNPNKPNMPAPAVEPDELSYYRLTLLSYLRESHPNGLPTTLLSARVPTLPPKRSAKLSNRAWIMTKPSGRRTRCCSKTCTFPGLTRSSPCCGTSSPTRCPQARPRGGPPASARMRQGVQRLRPDRRFRRHTRLRPAV